MIEISIDEIRIPLSPDKWNERIIVFREKAGERRIGVISNYCVTEAILALLNNVEDIVPLKATFELVAKLINLARLDPAYVMINLRNDDASNARLYFRKMENQKTKLANIDCRISDAIALALIVRVPLIVTEEVLEEFALSHDDPSSTPLSS